MKHYKGVVSVFSTRNGGVSKPPFNELNVAFHVGDKESDVLANQSLLLDAFPEHSRIQVMNQVHTDQVCHVDSLQSIPSCDALMTQQKGLVLTVMVADCIPILIYDPVHQAIAAVHAGRAGAFMNIVQKTVDEMHLRYKSRPEDIVVSMGPSIRSCCYEIGGDVIEEAKALGYETFMQTKEKSTFLDIRGIVKKQMHDAGILTQKIEDISECTSCRNEKYFSFRKEGQTGRFCGAIMLK